MDPIRWLRDVYGFLRFAFPRKDKEGKISGFLHHSDDTSVPDLHAGGEPFGRRVFVSFARASLPLAKRFENAFRAVGLEPWRYEPEEFAVNAAPPQRGPGGVVEHMEYLKKNYPETLRTLPATLRRCSAVFFLVSEDSRQSTLCELEAFVAMSIHSYGPGLAKAAAIYIVLERPDLKPSPWLSEFWSHVYEEGLEMRLATLIAKEIDSKAVVLRLSEELRSRIFK